MRDLRREELDLLNTQRWGGWGRGRRVRDLNEGCSEAGEMVGERLGEKRECIFEVVEFLGEQAGRSGGL